MLDLLAVTKHQKRELGKRHAARGDKNGPRRCWREIYGVIETVIGFVRSTCQGQVKMAPVMGRRERRQWESKERGQLESGSS